MKKRYFEENFMNLSDSDKIELDYYEILADIAIELKKLRKINSISQEEAAKLNNINQAMVSKYENGDYNPSIGKLFKYVRNLGGIFSFDISLDEKQDKIFKEKINITEVKPYLISSSKRKSKFVTSGLSVSDNEKWNLAHSWYRVVAQ